MVWLIRSFSFFLIAVLNLSCAKKEEALVYGVIDKVELFHLGIDNYKKVINYNYQYNGIKYTDKETFYVKIRNNYFEKDTIIVKVIIGKSIDSEIVGKKKKKEKFIKSFKGSSRDKKN